MTVHRKILLSSLILLVGLAAAWPFRHSADSSSEPSKAVGQPSPDKGQGFASGSSPADRGPFDLADHPALKGTQTPAPGAPSHTTEHQSQGVPVSSVVERTVDRPDPSAATGVFPRAVSEPAGGHPWPKQRNHVVHNGDTLEKLAERYLGDPLRAIEIFDLNRDQLANPHLLPIGAELRIPAAESGSL